MIILHGMFGSLANWRSLAKRFAAGMRVLTVDLRNHGRSEHDPVHTYRAMASDVSRFLGEHDAKPAIVMGHSMGAKVAMQLALDEPRAVAALIAVDMSPKAYRHGNEGVLQALRSTDLTTCHTREDVDRALATRIADPAVRAFLLMSLRRDHPDGFSWRFDVEALWQNRRALCEEVGGSAGYARYAKYAKYDGPALFLYGEESDYFGPADEKLVAERFPRARTVAIAAAGHWLHVDAPDAVYRAVLSFVESLP